MALPQAVVFDMDGTLLDTEVLARVCFLQACQDFELEVDVRVYDACVGATWEATEQIMKAGFGASFPYEGISARWAEHYHNFVDHKPVPLKAGIAQVLTALQARGLPMAVATSSRRPVVETKLALASIDHHFDFLICGGETPRGKPHADPYLTAAARLNVDPGQTWAVEDSDNGVRSAVAAGLIVFQIPDELSPSEEVLKLGHKIVPTALDLLPHLL
jgi:HAD superfamily hydrolase (TIGR01509 family)